MYSVEAIADFCLLQHRYLDQVRAPYERRTGSLDTPADEAAHIRELSDFFAGRSVPASALFDGRVSTWPRR